MYGETSLQVGKTCKLLGTLSIINEQPEEAQLYLLKAYSIFEDQGQYRLMNDVVAKLRLLKHDNKSGTHTLLLPTDASLSQRDLQGSQASGSSSSNPRIVASTKPKTKKSKPKSKPMAKHKKQPGNHSQ